MKMLIYHDNDIDDNHENILMMIMMSTEVGGQILALARIGCMDWPGLI